MSMLLFRLRSFFFLFILLTSVKCICQTKISSYVNIPRAKDAPALNMLFFGNSFTLGGAGYWAYRLGGVPRLVRELARAHGYPAPNIQEVCVNGVLVKYFYDNCLWSIQGNDDAARQQGFIFPDGHRIFRMMGNQDLPAKDAFPQGFQWDLVTFCQNDAGFLNDGKEMNEYALKIGELVRKHSPQARFMEYEPWARHVLLEWAAPPVRFQEKVGRAGWALTEAFNQRWPGSAILSPAGEAWYEIGFNRMLYAPDHFHGEAAGYLLNAMVLYRSIYGGMVDFAKTDSMRIKLEIADVNATKLRYLLDAANSVRITPFGMVDLNQVPNNFDQAMFLGMRRRQLGNYASAIRLYDQALGFATSTAQKAEALRGKGDALSGKRNYDQARNVFRSMLDLPKISAVARMHALNSIGMTYVEQKNLLAAATSFQEVLSIPELHAYDRYDNAYIASELYLRLCDYGRSRKMAEAILDIPGLDSYNYVMAIQRIMLCCQADNHPLDRMALLNRYLTSCPKDNLVPGHYSGIISQQVDILMEKNLRDEAVALHDRWYDAFQRKGRPSNLFTGDPVFGNRGQVYLKQAEIYLQGMDPAYFSKAQAKLNLVFTCRTPEIVAGLFPLAMYADDFVQDIRQAAPRQHAQAIALLAKIDFYSKGGNAQLTPWLKKLDEIKELDVGHAHSAKLAVQRQAALAIFQCNWPTEEEAQKIPADTLYKNLENVRKITESLGEKQQWRQLRKLLEVRQDLSTRNRFNLYVSLADKSLEAKEWKQAKDYYFKALKLDLPQYVTRQAAQKIVQLSRRNVMEQSQGLFSVETGVKILLELTLEPSLKDKTQAIGALRSLAQRYLKLSLLDRAEAICGTLWTVPDLSNYNLSMLVQLTNDIAKQQLQQGRSQRAKDMLNLRQRDKRLNANQRKQMTELIKQCN